jgi:hypothetical protein
VLLTFAFIALILFDIFSVRMVHELIKDMVSVKFRDWMSCYMYINVLECAILN